ncbi:MAG: hypothetical protein QM817_01575 [Archangium sp.]
MSDRVCQDHGLLVDGGTRLGTDPCEFFESGSLAALGCSRLRCSECKELVRAGPPGWGFKEGTRRTVGELFAAPRWEELPFLELKKPVLSFDQPVRLYACKCSSWTAERVDRIDNEHDSPNDPMVSWACEGHPLPQFPLTLGQLTLSEGTDCKVIVHRILQGSEPRALETRRSDGEEGPALWLWWLYVYLRGLPMADRLSEAIAERLDDWDPHVVGRVLLFFMRCPRAAGVERVVARAEAEPQNVAVRWPIPEYSHAPMVWSVLMNRLGCNIDSPLDARIGELARKIAVMPLSSLPHEDRGPTDLAERQRQLNHTLDPDTVEFLVKDRAASQKHERSDIVIYGLEGTRGFSSPAMRQFLADHILNIDDGAPGRWQWVLHSMTDWSNSKLGHLVVIAATRVIEAGRTTPDEMRKWITARRSYGWVTDEWVKPIEALLEQREKPFSWPDYSGRRPLPDGRSWTATFDSYDQYHEQVYFKVRLFQGEVWIAEFMVQAGTEWTGDNWNVPTFEPALTALLAELAAKGKTNTAYSR